MPLVPQQGLQPSENRSQMLSFLSCLGHSVLLAQYKTVRKYRKNCVYVCPRVHLCVGFNTNYGGLGLRLLFCFLRQGPGAHVKQIRMELTGVHGPLTS